MKSYSFLAAVLFLTAGTAVDVVGSGEPARSAAGPGVQSGGTSESLLERFRPALYFVEDSGPNGSRIDYPCSYVADDGQIENNYAELFTSGPELCYGYVHEQRDANGKLCWVLEYNYYYPRNWSDLPPPSGCFTHEHDWEWIYIVVGVEEGEIRPYCACFSGHTSGNPGLFDVSGKVRLFPSVAGGSVWRADWDRRPEWAPRVSLGWDEHAEATALGTGNAFDGSPTQPRSSVPWTHYEVTDQEGLGSTCSTMERFCYGDPQLAWLCIGRSPRGECDDPTDPPWMRAGLGAWDPLPADFALPDDWEENPSTEEGAEPTRGPTAWFAPNPCRGRIRVAFPAGTPPSHLDLLDVAGRLVRRFPFAEEPEGGGRDGLDLGGIPPGVYLFRARWPEESEEVQRVVLVQ
jgi:hypothetical protein